MAYPAQDPILCRSTSKLPILFLPKAEEEAQISMDKKRDVLALPKAWAVNQLAMLSWVMLRAGGQGRSANMKRAAKPAGNLTKRRTGSVWGAVSQRRTPKDMHL